MRKFLLTIFLVLISFYTHAEENLLISDIKVEGLQRIDPGLVFSNIPFEINDSIDEVNVSETIKLLYRTGQFRNISIEQEGSKVIIIVNEKILIHPLYILFLWFSAPKLCQKDKEATPE